MIMTQFCAVESTCVTAHTCHLCSLCCQPSAQYLLPLIPRTTWSPIPASSPASADAQLALAPCCRLCAQITHHIRTFPAYFRHGGTPQCPGVVGSTGSDVCSAPSPLVAPARHCPNVCSPAFRSRLGPASPLQQRHDLFVPASFQSPWHYPLLRIPSPPRLLDRLRRPVRRVKSPCTTPALQHLPQLVPCFFWERRPSLHFIGLTSLP